MFDLSDLPDQDTFVQRLNEICGNLNIDPNWLLAVMYIESSIDPTKENPSSGAVGLIQFLPSTLTGMGYTKDQVLGMSATQQLWIVEEFLKPYKPRLKTFNDLYLAVFYPSASGQGTNPNYQLPDSVGNSNRAYQNPNGSITVGSIMNKIKSLLPAQAQSFVVSAMNNWLPIAIGAGVLVFALMASSKNKKNKKHDRFKFKRK